MSTASVIGLSLKMRAEGNSVAEQVDVPCRRARCRGAVDTAADDVIRVGHRGQEHPDEEENIGEVLDVPVEDIAHGEQ